MAGCDNGTTDGGGGSDTGSETGSGDTGALDDDNGITGDAGPGSADSGTAGDVTAPGGSTSALPAPTGLKVKYIFRNTVNLEWNAVSGAVKYHIFNKYSTASTWDDMGFVDTPKMLNTELEAGKTVYYYVTAVDSSNKESAASSVIYATTYRADQVASITTSSNAWDFNTDGSRANCGFPDPVSGTTLWFKYKSTSSDGYVKFTFSNMGDMSGKVKITTYINTGRTPSSSDGVFTNMKEGEYVYMPAEKDKTYWGKVEWTGTGWESGTFTIAGGRSRNK
jgi:hypothetical protein